MRIRIALSILLRLHWSLLALAADDDVQQWIAEALRPAVLVETAAALPAPCDSDRPSPATPPVDLRPSQPSAEAAA